MWTRKTPSKETFYVVLKFNLVYAYFFATSSSYGYENWRECDR